MRINGQEVIFNVFKALEYSNEQKRMPNAEENQELEDELDDDMRREKDEMDAQ